MVKLTFWHYFIEKQVMPIYKIRTWICLCLITIQNLKLLGKATTWLCGICQKVFSIQNFHCYPNSILPWLKSQNLFNNTLFKHTRNCKNKSLGFQWKTLYFFLIIMIISLSQIYCICRICDEWESIERVVELFVGTSLMDINL